jgi:hypothetical protein
MDDFNNSSSRVLLKQGGKPPVWNRVLLLHRSIMAAQPKLPRPQHAALFLKVTHHSINEQLADVSRAVWPSARVRQLGGTC